MLLLLRTLKFRAMAKIIVTVILQGDNSLRRTKKRLIYSSPSLGVATTSNGSAVSRSVSNNVGAEQNVLPTSDKSSGLSNSTISHKQEKGNENPNASNEAIEPKESELERKIRERVENSHVPKLLKAIEKRYDKRVSNFVYGVF